MLIACAAEGLLGFLQFGLPADHFINAYARDAGDTTKVFGDDMGTRVIGTFSYISGYGAFLFFFGMFVWGLMVENKRSPLVIYGLTAVGLVSAFMNGSRSVVLPFILAAVFGFLDYGTIGNKIKGILMIALVASLAMIYNVGGKMTFIKGAYDAFAGRVTHGQASGESGDRVLLTFEALIDYVGKYPGFGVGLGATYQGATAKWGASPLLPAFEAEQERVIIEGGYFLLIIRILLLAFLLSRLKIPLYFSLPILIYLFMFLQLVFNINQCAYAFFGIMLVDKMYYLKEKRALGLLPEGA